MLWQSETFCFFGAAGTISFEKPDERSFFCGVFECFPTDQYDGLMINDTELVAEVMVSLVM